MSAQEDNIAVAKVALSHLEKRYQEQQEGRTEFSPLDYQPFFDLMTDDAVWWVPCPEGTFLYGEELKGKDNIIKLFTTDDPEHIDGLEMLREPEYFANEHRVVILYAFNYNLKNADMAARNKEIALVLTIEDGRITRAVEIQDMSEWVLAYQGAAS